MPQFVGNDMRPWGLECAIDPQDGVNAAVRQERNSAMAHTVASATFCQPPKLDLRVATIPHQSSATGTSIMAAMVRTRSSSTGRSSPSL